MFVRQVAERRKFYQTFRADLDALVSVAALYHNASSLCVIYVAATLILLTVRGLFSARERSCRNCLGTGILARTWHRCMSPGNGSWEIGQFAGINLHTFTGVYLERPFVGHPLFMMNFIC